ncbi:MAG: Gfo/Idh/MocA family oxidoreductase [Capsulimonadales bacterium]|nr:Gfo/Idh/MocA family oxidoreductase [Capsulimonadales bacterium]
MTDGPIYRVAIIGCGKRAREHVTGLRADSRAKVVALADVSQDAMEAFNADYGFEAAVYPDYRTLLEKEKPDVVIATLWPPLHLPVFRDAARNGVRAVLSEKPIAPTWGECLEMGRIAEETGCLLTFCHQRRFAHGNRQVREWLAEGAFGTLERMDLYSPPHLLDCGTHTVDQALSFNQEVPGRWVIGAVDTSETLNWFGVPAEIMATGTIVFENGVRASLQVGGKDADMWGGVRLHGTEGFLEVFWDGNFGRGRRYADPTWTPPKREPSLSEHMIGVIRNALDCLESGEEPELSHRKALRANEILFGLYESVRRRARVHLPLTGFEDNPLHTLLAETKPAA